MRAILSVICLASVSCTSPYPNAVPEAGDITSFIPANTEAEKNGYLSAANDVKKFERKLAEKQNRLATQKYAFSDVSAVGAVTSVIAAASGALTTALYAGGATVAGGVAGQRYSYDAQILNYRTTRQKLNCIYRAMTDISSEQLIVAMDDTRTPSVIQILKPYIRSVISDLAFELESEQSAVNLIAPDINAISKIINEKNAAIMVQRNLPRNKATEPNAVTAIAEVIRISIKACKISPTTTS
ncbi:hypothetical protein [Pantoea sp. SO10]|uniref:hypothetical protein n=1 Tax=Pantoea sp. SO10 TaxID=2575375 RepID=UPI0010C9588F|nr:hypothetical protein [Pantoea sp. SO10]QCP62352.1 hypothetical protein FCN45_23370 [Pantoea sp. SO10]